MQFMQQVKEKLRPGLMVLAADPLTGRKPVAGTIASAPRKGVVKVHIPGYATVQSVPVEKVVPRYTRYFLAKGNPEYDCLTWYHSVGSDGRARIDRIEGYDENPKTPTRNEDGQFESTFGPAMSMSFEAALAEDSAYLPADVRAFAAQHLAALDSGTKPAQ